MRGVTMINMFLGSVCAWVRIRRSARFCSKSRSQRKMMVAMIIISPTRTILKWSINHQSIDHDHQARSCQLIFEYEVRNKMLQRSHLSSAQQKQQPAEDDGGDNHHLINSKDPEVKTGFLSAAFRKGSYNCFFLSFFKEKKCCSRSKLHLCAGWCVRRHQILGTVLQLCSRTN